MVLVACQSDENMSHDRHFRLGYEVETAIASTKPRVQFTHLRFFYVRKRSTVNYAVVNRNLCVLLLIKPADI